ncbi:DUF2147 domain-containing protein [Sphingobium sp. CR2-8]|uniref:DUF2147 domain-containing protein n=1 Tax=Sphingobium sp. CR2-8 TaxID=1306534 RepID=UPI002DBC029D|nr:DUF2147 domain-containing protein [Sphingobium sp. CR2-8]MEC3912419.1 DUF2147 domain-containing protein [Sphingobium sp. CR2-8]
MRRFTLSLICAAVMVLPAAAMAAAPIEGNWVNPHGSVVVTTGACRGALCGWVRWADASATADAADAGVSHLVGTELLQDYHPRGPGRWAGYVFVPDRGRSFSSTIEQLDADRLKISGCLLGGWLCKSQIWTRQRG